MLNKILFVFFSRKWRLNRSDFLMWSILWFLFFTLLSYFFFLIIWNFLNKGLNNIFFLLFSIYFILILILFYSGYCLNKKRLYDLWLNKSPFWIKGWFIIYYKEWNDQENEFWSINKIFDIILKPFHFIIIIIVLFFFFQYFLINNLQANFNNNSLVIESRKSIINNDIINNKIWPNIEFWFINWNINTINNKWSLSLNYSVTWDTSTWKVLILWHKENLEWVGDKMIILIWEEEHNLLFLGN